MPLLLQFVAMLCAVLLAATTLYIKFSGQPARPSLTLAQAPLAIVGSFYGTGAWLLAGGGTWLIATLIIGIVVPTFVNILPTLKTAQAPEH